MNNDDQKLLDAAAAHHNDLRFRADPTASIHRQMRVREHRDAFAAAIADAEQANARLDQARMQMRQLMAGCDVMNKADARLLTEARTILHRLDVAAVAPVAEMRLAGPTSKAAGQKKIAELRALATAIGEFDNAIFRVTSAATANAPQHLDPRSKAVDYVADARGRAIVTRERLAALVRSYGAAATPAAVGA